MKKIFSLLMTAILCISFSTVDAASSPYAKQLKKQRQKEYKAKLKEIKKGGWQIFNTSHTLEVALLTHYEKLMEEGVYEQASNSMSSLKNIGTAKLLQDACEKYATEIGAELKGKTVTEHASDASEEDLLELDNFLQGYKTKVQAEIAGEMKPSYFLYREIKTASGKAAYEFQGYFIVDKESAHKARLKAYKAMMAEQAAAHALSEKTEKWIDEAFKE